MQINPRDEQTWNNKGNTLFALGRKEAALTCYDQVLRLNQEHVQAWNNKSVTLYQMGRHAETAKAFAVFIKIAPPQYLPHIQMVKKKFRGLGYKL